MIEKIIEEIKTCCSKEFATFSSRVLRVSNSSDVVLGCRVPNLRRISKVYGSVISPEAILELLRSEFHEVRFLAILFMIYKFEKENIKKPIVETYLANTKFVNNWDLVDVSAHKIIGAFFDESNSVFWELAKSDYLWDNRIAIVSSWNFIKKNSLDLTFDLAEYFLNHKHHMIQKASGWMLREAGKKNEKRLIEFLKTHKDKMPKITLSYSCEKLQPLIKKKIMQA